MGKMIRDTANQAIQVFTPRRVQAVTATQAWTPGTDDRVFMATVDQNVAISGGTQFALSAFVPLGIVASYTYTFDTTSTILVM
jgi:hypothetical protein